LSGELVINTWRDISADPKHPSYTVYLLIEEWKKNHPNVTVTYQPMLGTVPELFGFITTNLRSGQLGDVVMQYFPSPAQLDPDLQHDFAPELAQPLTII
jgi:ABC-type glycerol-3-phosphate transport system substrate-binding protein